MFFFGEALSILMYLKTFPFAILRDPPMLTVEEAQQLMAQFIELRETATESAAAQAIFEEHQRVCVQKFMYLVTMRTNRYKSYSNHEDLVQEGLEALTKAMANYNAKKGNFFWWAHRYIGTRISRSANTHTTIRYPLAVAKDITPHKEMHLPLLIEEIYCPDKQVEASQVNIAIHEAMDILSVEQRNILNLAYGLNGESKISLSKICQQLNVSRLTLVNSINDALTKLKERIKI
jgi:RNA polymerase sigma factor (sigma-70 family)